DAADRRIVLNSGEAEAFEIAEKGVPDDERIRSVHSRNHWRMPHDRKDLVGHFHNDPVGIAICKQTRARATPSHTVAPRVIHDDEIGPASFLALRRQADTGAGADDWLPGVHHFSEPVHELGARETWHGIQLYAIMEK